MTLLHIGTLCAATKQATSAATTIEHTIALRLDTMLGPLKEHCAPLDGYDMLLRAWPEAGACGAHKRVESGGQCRSPTTSFLRCVL